MKVNVRKLVLLLPLLAQDKVQAELKCKIDGFQVAATAFGSVDFEFWYAVGLVDESSVLDGMQIFKLEEALYSSIDEEVLWCTKNADWDNQNGQRSIMSEEDASLVSGESGLRKRAILQNSGVVGPVLFTPGRKDELTDFECPEGLQSRAEECLVMKGMMRILAYDIDRVEQAIWGIRTSIRSVMESNTWEREELRSVKFLAYLGDTEEQAVRGGGAGGGFAFITNSVNDQDDEDGGGLWLLIVPLLLLLLVLLVGIFTYKNIRQRRTSKESEVNTERAVVGTGDHPESYHRGSYHYSPDGQQYLSTLCDKCLATRKEYFYYLGCAEKAGLDGRLGHGVFLANRLALDSPKDEVMGTIKENEPYRSLPVHPHMNSGLAQRHWGNDVHNCGSALCQRCSERKGSPMFIKAKTRKPIDPEASQQLDSIWVDPSLRTSPLHAEV